ncbi:glycosyltransferase, partial [Planctomycetota bacterium]|nr:glycosyltransferase [Planctomycetota bacterium]
LEAISKTNLSLDIIGDGKDKDLQKLQETIATLELSSRVRLRGRMSQPEIPEAVSDCLCAVHPLPAGHSISAKFTSPLKVMEYMAMGLPIVASDVPSVTEVLTDGHNAKLFEAGNVDSLAAVLMQMSDSEVAGQLGLQANIDCESYTYRRRAEALLKLFAAASDK